MNFPVFCTAVSAQGTVKATAGAVNVPAGIAGQRICPGDAVLADDDGVVVVPRRDVGQALSAATTRAEKEAATRAAFRRGELGLDRYGLRDTLARLGVEYLDYHSYQDTP
jgi:4-hydroxy-4-methyl-2-oxoglutarate aldolase